MAAVDIEQNKKTNESERSSRSDKLYTAEHERAIEANSSWILMHVM